MTELEMCKAIAKLEGLQSVEYKGLVLVSHGFSCDKPYNPIADLALNCKARDDYEVSIDHTVGYVYITQGWHDIEVHFESKVDIPKASIECILKSKGLWKD